MVDATTPEQPEINVRDLATLVAGLSRFLTRLSNMPAFQKAGLGLGEWSALSIIAERGGISNGQLANALGVSAQRINQITDSLKVSTLISLSVSTEDARKKLVSITPAGTEKLQELNVTLRPIIATALGTRPQALSRTGRMINGTLMRIVLPPKVTNAKV